MIRTVAGLSVGGVNGQHPDAIQNNMLTVLIRCDWSVTGCAIPAYILYISY